MGMLTEHFSLEEMTFSETAARLDLDNKPLEWQLSNLKETAQRLERIRELLGLPIVIKSGFRSSQVNKSVGGSSTSSHCEGLACDFVASGMQNYEAAKIIAESDLDFDQLILEYGWVHVGFGPRMRLEILTKKSSTAPYEKGLVS